MDQGNSFDHRLLIMLTALMANTGDLARFPKD